MRHHSLKPCCIFDDFPGHHAFDPSRATSITMQLTRALKLLVVGLSAISVAEATFVDVNRVAVGNGRAIQRRQDDSEGDSKADPTTTGGTAQTETTKDPEPEPTTASPSSTPTTTPPKTSSSTPEPTTSSPSPTKQQPTESTSGPEPTTPPEETSSSRDDSESSASEETITIVTTKTNADGSKETLTSASVTKITPGLANNGNNNNQDTGMSTQTRNTVIGVVVGVGGAIILGGLGFVAWRIWGRKKHQEENDVLMDYGSGVEKPDTGNSMNGRTPFQSTLESYHAPTPNTAANF